MSIGSRIRVQTHSGHITYVFISYLQVILYIIVYTKSSVIIKIWTTLHDVGFELKLYTLGYKKI